MTAPKRTTLIIILILVFLSLLGLGIWYFVGGSHGLTKVSEDHPFAIEIKKERSLYQARKIMNRLREKGLPSYVMSIADSLDGGQWYSVLLDARETKPDIDSALANYQRIHGFPSPRIVDYRELRTSLADPDTMTITEVERISAATPAVSSDILEAVKQFPNTNLFFIQNFKLADFSDKSRVTASYAENALEDIDLPRGITMSEIHTNADLWAEAVYTDNIYGDHITIDLLRVSNGINAEDLCRSFAGSIRSAGGKRPAQEKSYQSKDGNIRGVILRHGPVEKPSRTHLVLYRQGTPFVMICQSTKRTTEDLESIASHFGAGVGMNEFDEFYNLFYTIPSRMHDNEYFALFHFSKLPKSYAVEKDNVDWARRLVGHWSGVCRFVKQSGETAWSYQVFDLLTAPKSTSVYRLYSKRTPNDAGIDVFGGRGFYINKKEINFFHDRYISAVAVELSSEAYMYLDAYARVRLENMYDDVSSNVVLSLALRDPEFLAIMEEKGYLMSFDDLKKRAESLQFEKDGYSGRSE